MRKVKQHRLPKNDLTGRKFGFLEVLKMAQTEKSGKKCIWRAICKCHNCGNKNYDADPQAIKRGLTKSCGCDKSRYNKMRGEKSSLYKGYGEISGKLWRTITNRANRRKYLMDIDIQYVWELYLKQDKKCALSGLPISFFNSNLKSSKNTASLDRIDSNKGYIKGNVQWVHKAINIMKNKLDDTLFINLCRKISENNINSPIIEDSELIKNPWAM